jgi:RNA polymerase sigma factor (sigma-70 family)
MSESFEQQNLSDPPTPEIPQLADHLFRHEAGKLVSVLTGIFGVERLQLAEDVVQEAMVRALKTWPYYGVPKNPAAWLTQTAKNLALDVIRREKNFHEKQPEVVAQFEQWSTPSENSAPDPLENELADDRLRLMFACCHPALPEESQTALALKTLCGFSPAEIAKAFLSTEVATNKRLTRARQRIRELHVPFAIPSPEEMPGRLEAVLQTVYLLFNEGYKASSGEKLIREDLCHEAIRLVTSLAAHPIGDLPKVHALAALMLLNAARLPARVDAEGNPLRLEEQDRSKWDRRMIARGMLHLARSAGGDEITEYHLQAGIAAVHCRADNFESTDWRQILSLYDRLVQIDDSPVVALNRAVAVAQVHGPRAGLDAIESIRNQQALESYHFLYAVLADFEYQLNEFEAAAKHLRRAIDLTELDSERAFLSRRFELCVGRRTEA